MQHQVFISYSHKDGALVTPVVRLLRATKDFVFLDIDTIQPGRKWQVEINKALNNSSLIVVFWCLHSQQSVEVRGEYQAAIKAEKDVLPVLLDSTPVPDDLAGFQWVDFRELVQERHSQVEGADFRERAREPQAQAYVEDLAEIEAPLRALRVGNRKLIPLGILSAIVLVFFLSLSVMFWKASTSQSTLSEPLPNPKGSAIDLPQSTPRAPLPSPTKRTGPRPRPTVRSKPTPIPSPTAVNEPTPVPSASESPNYPITTPDPDFTLLIIVLVIIGALVGGLALLMWYGRKKEKRLVADATSVVQEQMSANLEEEIRRRLSTVE